MGISYNPSIVTEGLVLGLDPQSPRFYNYKGRSVAFVESNDDGFNVSNSTGWFNPNNTSQWTLEGWILNPSSTNKFSIYSGTNGSVANFGCSIGGAVAFQSGNGAWSWVTNTTIVADTGSPTGWNHFAFTKNGSTFEVFLNGSRIYTGTPTFGTGGTGGSIHLQSYFSDGNYYEDAAGLSNVRYVTGSVLYSGTSYTVPTEPLTAISGTQLLVYQDTTFTDASSNGLTLTVQNSPTISYNGPFSDSGWTDLTNSGNSGTLTNGPVFIPGGPFNNSGGSVYFDGNADRINIPASSDFNFGTGDFTVEWFQYLPSTPSEHLTLLSINYGTNPNFSIQGNGSTSTAYALYFNGISTVIIEGSSCPLNQWVHYAVVRNGSGSNNVKIYRDGVQTGQGTYTGNAGNSSSTNYIGGDATNSSVDFKGYVSNLRILKGTALYTGAFTPPTGPLEAIDDTVLLTCQGGAITDNGPNSHAITVNNDAKAVTASAFEFDGTNDYAVTSSNTDFLFGTEEFAIEWWEYFTDGTGYAGHIGVFKYGGGNNTAHIWTVSGSFHGYPGSWTSIAMKPISNQWAHYVVTGTSGDIRFYQNGELKDTKTWDWSATSSTSNFAVGGTPGWSFGNYAMAGKISAVKVYKGKSFTEDEVKRNFSALRGRYGI